MVSRYREFPLGSLTAGEALDAVYRYSKVYRSPVTEETAPYLADVCYNDAYYIAQMFRSNCPEKDLTTEEGIRETLKYETTAGKGDIAKVWLEYLTDAIREVNDRYAKQVIIYLARHGQKEITRAEILKEIKHGLTEDQLEKRMRELVFTDMIARGTTNMHYKGLGDPVFEIVFRRLYEAEIGRAEHDKVEKDIERKLIQVRNRANYEKGLLGEYRLMKRLEEAVEQKRTLKDLVVNPVRGFTLKSIASIRKERIFISHEVSVEIDLYLKAEQGKGSDFAIEVKSWKRKLPFKEVKTYLERVKLLKKKLDPKKTGFILYSQKGFTQKQLELLKQEKIMMMDGTASYWNGFK
jgi:hypothetical protein